jgi:hypothetical protein
MVKSGGNDAHDDIQLGQTNSSCSKSSDATAATPRTGLEPCGYTRTKCSIERDPRRQDHTICTVVAPGTVFTVRTKASSVAYGPLRVQIPTNPNTKRQVSHPQSHQNPKHEPSQVITLRAYRA